MIRDARVRGRIHGEHRVAVVFDDIVVITAIGHPLRHLWCSLCVLTSLGIDPSELVPNLDFTKSVGNDWQSRLDEEFSARKRRNRTIGDSSALCHKSPVTDTFPLGYRPLPLAFTYVCRLSPPTWPGKLYRKTVVRRFPPPIAHTRARSLWRHHHLDCWFAR